MRTRDLADLLLLSALWGASFLFMRYAAPTFGPIALVEVRVAIAAAFLIPLLIWRGGLTALCTHWRRISLVGIFNSALPFVLFTYATLWVTAGFASILNAVTPMWTALIAWLWLRDRIDPSRALGLAIGVSGVIVLVWGKVDVRPGSSQWSTTLAVAAALLATLSYGVSANYAKHRLGGVLPLAIAAGSQLSATIAVAPLALLFWPQQSPPAIAWFASIALGVACSALAYILYFRLIARVGAMRAASVTFLIPVFATAWGALFLSEVITARMVVGGAVILLGTALTLGLLRRPQQTAD